MRVRLNNRDLAEQKADVAACFAYEGDKQPRGIADAGLRRVLSRQMKLERFQGRRNDRLVWNLDHDAPARRYLVIGLGRPEGAAGEALRTGCAQAAKQASEFKARSLAVKLPPPDDGRAAEEIRAAVEGALLGAYRFDAHLTDPARRDPRIESLDIAGNGTLAALRKAARLGEAAGEAVWLARDLVNEGPSRLTPRAMARRAGAAARRTGLKSRVLGALELKRLGLKALLSVSRGSDEPPQLVHLVYRPKTRGKSKRVLLVGKGVTFDSGGLNLKPGNSMLHMKGDMAGAAAVLATMTALAAVGCRAEVHGLLGLTENMTGGAAYKPGDILDTFSGKTVEVGNTDAEGRLVLCDLLAYGAKRIKPDLLLDVATLTGACVVALGPQATGVFSRHDALREALLEAGERAGEKLWPLPMYEEYLQQLQKGPADLCNVGGRWGGATLAALFLGEFVPREVPWVHLDIAGPAFAESDTAEAREGGTGAGVRTLLRWLESV